MISTAKNLLVAIALSTPLAFSQAVLAASDTASESAEPPGGTGTAVMPMQEHTAKPHDTTNPEERGDLMRKHAKGMMRMMHGMMAGQRGGMAPDMGAMMVRMGMMEQRMYMMQMRMDQMLQQRELILEDRNDGDS